jgi:hypothetical protein
MPLESGTIAAIDQRTLTDKVMERKVKLAKCIIEMSSPRQLIRAGWKPTTVMAGEKITVVIYPLRDGGKQLRADLKSGANPANYVKDLWGDFDLTGRMKLMSAVMRIKAELALRDASRRLLTQHPSLCTSSETRPYADTATVVRKELDKLVEILADDASEKHWNVAARVAKCADYLAPIPSPDVQHARLNMLAAHKVLQDVAEIIF